MDCRGVAPFAVFLEFKFLCLLLFVDGCCVIASFALCAGESDYVCHVKKSSFRDCENVRYFSTAGINHSIIFIIHKKFTEGKNFHAQEENNCRVNRGHYDFADGICVRSIRSTAHNVSSEYGCRFGTQDFYDAAEKRRITYALSAIRLA